MDVEHRQLGEQRLADQLAEGADDDRLGPRGADPLQRRLVVDVLGLQQLDPQLARGLGGRRRRQLAAAALAAVGRGDDQRRAVRRVGQAPQDGGGELGGAEVDGPHASVRGSRSSPSSLVVVLGRRAVAAALAQRPQRALALLAAGAVEDQDAVEVVDLVLEHPRLEARGLDRRPARPRRRGR